VGTHCVRETSDDAFGTCLNRGYSALICGLLTVDPVQRMTLPDVHQHPWCMRYTFSLSLDIGCSTHCLSYRPSQLAQQGVGALADKLTESLRINGDLGFAAPDLNHQGCELSLHRSTIRVQL